MNNCSLIDFTKKLIAKLHATDDPTLKECSMGSSIGYISSKLWSDLLSSRFPELFAIGFCMTLLIRKDESDENILLAQYFMIGHMMSNQPGFIPAFIAKEEVDQGSIKEEILELGFEQRGNSLSRGRKFFNTKKIMRIAEEIFELMCPDARNEDLDFQKIDTALLESFVPMGRCSDEFILENHANTHPSKAKWEHFRTNYGYKGSMILTSTQCGDINSLDGLTNFSKFYQALRQVMAKYIK